jgi:O-antigen ligase
MKSIAYAALWVFVFSIPWERVLVLTGVSVMTRLMGAIALGLALLAMVVSGRIRRWRFFHVLALVFVIWAGVGVLLFHVDELPSKFYTFVQLFLVLWIIWELAPSRQQQVNLLLAYVLGAYVASLDTLWIFAQEAGSSRRFASADPNNLAMTLALGLPMAWYLGMTHYRAFIRWVCRAYLPLSLLAIALTGSRGGMITSIVALMVIPLAMPRLSPGKLSMAIALLVLSGALAVAYVPETTVERLATTGESVQSLSFGGRLRLWKAGMHAFLDRPVLGYGTAAFRHAITPELGYLAQVAHNSYLSVAVEEGLIGLLLFLAMLFSVLLAVFRLPRLERRYALVLLAALCVAMLPLTWEDQKPVWFIMAALIGMAHAEVNGARMAPEYRAVRRPAAAVAGSARVGGPRGPFAAPRRTLGPDQA